ncbi:MAG: DsbA family protein [Spirochaetota bacterium]
MKIRLILFACIPVTIVFAGEASFEPADRLRIHALEIELYHLRLRAEKKVLLKKLKAREARKSGISVEEWEKEFREKNSPNIDEKRMRELVKEGEEAEYEKARELFFQEFEAALNERLWQDLSKRYGVRLSVKPPRTPEISLETNGYLIHGDANAPIEVVEFFDIDCPYCRQSSVVYAKLRKKFAGRLRWISIDFPSARSKPGVMSAHLALHCAASQGKYFVYQERLFARQAELNEALLVSVARNLGMNLEAFAACRRDPGNHIATRIMRGIEYAKSLGIPGTPTLFINRRPYPGIRSFDQLKMIMTGVSP